MQTSSSQSVNIFPIPAFNDNYIWALVGHDQTRVTVVDPGCADSVIQFLESNDYQLDCILVTHHHYDHVDGIADLLKYGQHNNWAVNVYGPMNENIPHCSHKLVENDTVYIPHLELTFTVIDVPGHTAGHIAYYAEDILFCGDTLFSGGCGRVFEGTPEQMHQSLLKLKNLPDDTLVFCAHEYTQSNLEFALNVEPNNLNLINYFNHVTNLRNNGKSTIPTSIGLEKNINPFLRTENSEIIESANLYSESANNSDSAVFKVIREWKNNF